MGGKRAIGELRIQTPRAAKTRKLERSISLNDSDGSNAAALNTSTKTMNDTSYRQVPATDHFNGYNSRGEANTLLIVYEPNNKNLAREYYLKSVNACFWACLGCKDFNNKLYIKIKNREVFAPLKHYCQPKNIENILKEQEDYKILSMFDEAEYLDAVLYCNSDEFEKFDSGEYKFGMNKNKRPNSRLIVNQKGNPQHVYHYFKQRSRWSYGGFVDKVLYLPKQHVCDPFTVEESENEQLLLASDIKLKSQVDKLYDEQKINLRELYEYDFEYGATTKGNERKIIVCDPLNRSLVREFRFQAQSIWFCVACQNKRHKAYVIKKDEHFYTSVKHKCKPIAYFDAMCKQIAPRMKQKKIQYLTSQKGKEMPMRNNFQANETLSTAACLKKSDATVSTNLFTAKIPASYNSIDEKPAQTLSTISYTRFNSNLPSSEIMSKILSRKAVPSKSKQQNIDSRRAFKVDPPSDAYLQATLEKLKIPFTRQALHFWAEVLFLEVSTASKPATFFNISSSPDSFFKCLSCFFTSKEDHYFFIKGAIQSYFHSNFKSFEPTDEIDFANLNITSPEFQKLYCCNELTSIHYNFISSWLECRFGIFRSGIFEQFGKWDKENYPILMMENDVGFYKPILTLL
uniref:Uncharacterized protein n=1 Tax=Panagrolaimus davidi TaxID=227884 RepID=A0A914PF30_9BILA